jgi:hypothetical protein
MEADKTREAATQLSGEIGRLLAGIAGAVGLPGGSGLASSTRGTNNNAENEARASAGGNASPTGGRVAASLLPVVSRILQPDAQVTTTRTSSGGWLRWLNPLASFIGLFAGSQDDGEVAPAAVKRSTAPPLNYSRGIRRENDWRPEEIDYSGDGRVRPVAATSAPSVVVQVQAIDSRSFLDHSDAIADAVKKSLLESHTLAETVREL